MSENKNYVNGFGFKMFLLTLLFIGLRLTGHINWSWWWVLSPMWIGLIISIVLGVILGIIKSVLENQK